MAQRIAFVPGFLDVIVISGSGTVRRFKRVMQNGSVPPLDLDCQWQ